MPIRRPRFTIRRLMILVALVGLACGVVSSSHRLARRKALYRREMMDAVVQTRLTRSLVELAEDDLTTLARLRRRFQDELHEATLAGEGGRATARVRARWLEGLSADEAAAARRLAGFRACLGYWQARRERYRLAARAPWFGVAPDPPAPPQPE